MNNNRLSAWAAALLLLFVPALTVAGIEDTLYEYLDDAIQENDAAKVDMLLDLAEKANDKVKLPPELQKKLEQYLGDQLKTAIDARDSSAAEKIISQSKSIDLRGNKLAEATTEINQATDKLKSEVSKGDADGAKEQLAILKEIVANNAPRDIGWSTPEERGDFLVSLYAGVEGVTVQDLNEKAKIRAGIVGYDQLVRFKPVNSFRALSRKISRSECYDGLDEPVCGIGFGIHGWLSTLLTSTAEQSKSEADAMAMTNATMDQQEIEQALEAELGLYLPIFQKKHDKFGSLLVGPVLQTSITTTEDSERFNRRSYGGLRFAYSPESWVDFLYGKTEGLSGRRAEVRFQWPVENLAAGGRLFVGASFNLGVKNNEEDADTFRLHLTWNTNITKLLQGN